MTILAGASRTFTLLALIAVAAGCATLAPVRTAADPALLAAQSAREAILAADTQWSLVRPCLAA